MSRIASVGGEGLQSAFIHNRIEGPRLQSNPSVFFAAGLTAKSLYPFFRNDRHHDESRHRIGPPPADQRIKQETRKQDGREISTKLSLF